MPGKGRSSRFMQRCVADVTGQGKDLKSAFAICTAQSQKSGYSEPGSRKQTPKGAARERVFKGDPDMGSKKSAFEKAVKAGRKHEDMAAVFAGMAEADYGAWKSSGSRMTRDEAAKRTYEAIRAAARVKLGFDDLLDAMEGRVNGMPELPDPIRKAAMRELERERTKLDDITKMLRAHAESFEEGKWR